MSFHKVLVVLELSSIDAEVFEQAVDLAWAQKAHLAIAHCLSDLTDVTLMTQTFGTGMGFPATPGTTISPNLGNMDLIEEANEKKHEIADKILSQYQQKALARGISVEYNCYQGTGSIGSQICQMARDYGADVIVLGRKGHSGLTEAILGSVSNHVVHHAPCSVLVIQGKLH